MARSTDKKNGKSTLPATPSAPTGARAGTGSATGKAPKKTVAAGSGEKAAASADKSPSTASKGRTASPATPPPAGPAHFSAAAGKGSRGGQPEDPASIRPPVASDGRLAKIKAFFRFWFARPGRAWASAGILLLLVSLAFLGLGRPLTMRLYLEYPRIDGKGVQGEVRFVPWRFKPEERARLVLQEILLGPEAIHSRRLLSPSARISTILLRKSVLYADIHPEFLHDPPPAAGNWEADFRLIRRLLRVNLPSLRSVVLTVDGREVYEMPREEPETSDGTKAGEG